MPFTTEILISPHEETVKCTTWKVVEPLNFHSEKSGKNYVVPAGTITDLKSSLRKNAAAAAIVHDHLYQKGEYYKQIEGRQEADRVFLEAQLDTGVGTLDAWIAYFGVRIFGQRYYKETHENTRRLT